MLTQNKAYYAAMPIEKAAIELCGCEKSAKELIHIFRSNKLKDLLGDDFEGGRDHVMVNMGLKYLVHPDYGF